MVSWGPQVQYIKGLDCHEVCTEAAKQGEDVGSLLLWGHVFTTLLRSLSKGGFDLVLLAGFQRSISFVNQ